ncbi:hypothetical protein SK1NUM_18990 [Arachnia rubra]|nr:hypothetical protein SK1NUM_18990 [Arachnia rubra]
MITCWDPPRSEETDIWAETEALIKAANRSESASDDLLGEFEALDSQATFDHVLFESQAFGMHAEPTSQDELDYLGLPGLLEPDQVSTLLADRQRRQLKRRERKDPKSKPEVPLHRALANQRKELNSLVAQLARLEQRPHSHVHADLRRECGGPPLAQATTEQVTERIAKARSWLRR